MVISRLDVVVFTGLYEPKAAESSLGHRGAVPQVLAALGVRASVARAAVAEIGEPGGA
jgi:hypothetical protein